MSRGKKLDLFIGADFNEGWAEVQSPRKSQISSEILEPKKHTLHFAKEKRRGKVVTLVGPFHLSKADTARKSCYTCRPFSSEQSRYRFTLKKTQKKAWLRR